MINLPRVVLVTGASRSLGASIAKTFLENNDVVYVNYNKIKFSFIMQINHTVLI